MRLLIGAVIGMGVLIVIGLVVLIAGIVYKAGETAGPEMTGSETAAPAAVGKLRTGAVSLGLPAAAKVLRMTEVRGGLAVLVLMPSGEQVIYAVPLDRRQAPFRIQVTGPKGGE
ncbi:MAG: hypothetical protein F4114_07285 [Rhodospirillaceae bacterium]|nr:hypothetical protein [Rhodospirillaceae bacterium]